MFNSKKKQIEELKKQNEELKRELDFLRECNTRHMQENSKLSKAIIGFMQLNGRQVPEIPYFHEIRQDDYSVGIKELYIIPEIRIFEYKNEAC